MVPSMSIMILYILLPSFNVKDFAGKKNDIQAEANSPVLMPLISIQGRTAQVPCVRLCMVLIFCFVLC